MRREIIGGLAVAVGLTAAFTSFARASAPDVASVPDAQVAAASAPAASSRTIPPSLSADALRDELARGRRERQAEAERLADERKSLEALAAEIDGARKALQSETTRLERALEKAKDAAPAAADPGGAAQAGEAPPAADTGELPQKTDDASATAGADVDADRLAHLAKSLRGMKPQQAAALVGRVERPLAARLLASMRPADSGPILARLPPEKAGRLVEEMARLPLQDQPR
ncbi:hypothetical protein [Vulgatibacter incomptus]|uniref:Magnesium transporter MgtE intracellular domain-containing protein n=1 Tax=Vulgatibacter incomptus TaxID=1391653 RepID=A0A0K1PIT9_9BACT|nr:hypothetical protein [Vulgatibacter incomptus]AKU93024.1 hypothetical protein AKJ08_3411 [Vulgatibacter incomptus]